jgi:type II secretory pathway pseudopilin PulG
MINKNNQKKNRGFTIIETLVAVTILMIAIAGPLTVANKAYRAALDARNQMIGLNLAQEEMEYIKNLKDNFSIKYKNWFGLLYNNCNIDGSRVCIIDTESYSGNYRDSLYIPQSKSSPCTDSCKLYVNNYGYAYDTAGAGTPFVRYFYLKNASSGLSYSEYLVTVVVSWKTGTMRNQVQLQEFMTNADR